MESLRTLSNNDLLNRLNKLVKKEHQLSLEILPDLLEVGDRGLHLRAGYPSLFKYCVDSLGFSESTAVRRIRAARCARDFPEVYRRLEQREIKIVDAAKIRSVITADNEKELLSAIAGKSQREVDEIVALYGQPVKIHETVRVVKVARPIEPPPALAAGAPLEGAGGQRAAECKDFYRHCGGRKSSTLPEPSYEKRYQYNFTASEELNARIERCKALLSGKYPEGVSQELLMEELTEMFLERRDPERRAERREKRKSQPKVKQATTTEPSRYISPATRDKVYTRDKGRCTYVGSNGKRCNATWDLEIHHDDIPYAHGGDHSINNLRLSCAAHNKYEAEHSQYYNARGAAKRPERVFGKENQNKFKRKRE